MFKLVVLTALVAVAVAKPSGLAYAAHGVYALPAAVSSSYRSDIVSSPVVSHYAAPAVFAAPVAVPAAVSSSYRTDVIKPTYTAYAAPAVVSAPFIAAPVVQKTVVAPVAVPAAVSSSYRSDVIQSQPILKTISYGAYAPVVKAW